MSKIAVDTNILLYFLDVSNPEKRNISGEILLNNALFNSQTLSEVINVLSKRWKYPKEKITEVIRNFLSICDYAPISATVISLSFELIPKYDFQIFDALIVASALDAGCTKLYTEDMQNGLWVEKQLEIINPF